MKVVAEISSTCMYNRGVGGEEEGVAFDLLFVKNHIHPFLFCLIDGLIFICLGGILPLSMSLCSMYQNGYMESLTLCHTQFESNFYIQHLQN